MEYWYRRRPVWGQGDFNGDGRTNVLDFNVWNEHTFTSATEPGPLVEGQVPEPATLALMAVGLVVFGLRRLWRSG